MSFEMTKKARIVQITKTKMEFCNSKHIQAVLETANHERIEVNWASTPSVVCNTRNYSSKAKIFFEEAWFYAGIGSMAIVVHPKDPYESFFYLI